MRAGSRDIPKYSEANVDKEISSTPSDHPDAHWRHCKTSFVSMHMRIYCRRSCYSRKIVMMTIRSAEIGFVPAMVWVWVCVCVCAINRGFCVCRYCSEVGFVCVQGTTGGFVIIEVQLQRSHFETPPQKSADLRLNMTSCAQGSILIILRNILRDEQIHIIAKYFVCIFSLLLIANNPTNPLNIEDPVLNSMAFLPSSSNETCQLLSDLILKFRITTAVND